MLYRLGEFGVVILVTLIVAGIITFLAIKSVGADLFARRSSQTSATLVQPEPKTPVQSISVIQSLSQEAQPTAQIGQLTFEKRTQAFDCGAPLHGALNADGYENVQSNWQNISGFFADEIMFQKKSISRVTTTSVVELTSPSSQIIKYIGKGETPWLTQSKDGKSLDQIGVRPVLFYAVYPGRYKLTSPKTALRNELPIENEVAIMYELAPEREWIAWPKAKQREICEKNNQ